MENNKELKEVQENYERVEQNVAQKDFYWETKRRILEWAKDYQENEKNKYYYSHILLYIRSVIIEQRLSRLQAFALTGLITTLLNDTGYMNDDIDNNLCDILYSTIYEEGIIYYPISFSDDPPDEDPKQYAWSNKWRMWKEE